MGGQSGRRIASGPARRCAALRGPAIDATVLSLILRHGVPLVALLIFAGELGVPTGIPAEVALVLAGAYAVHSLPGLVAGVALVAAADLVGTTVLHVAARTGGVRLLERFLPGREEGRAAMMERWRRRLGRHDAIVVFAVRLLPLVRMYIAIGSGLLRIRIRTFLFGAAPAALLWAGIPLVLGYRFRANVHGITERYTRASHAFLFLLPVVGLVTALAWWIRRGPSPRGRVHRGRAALGFLAVLATAAYVVKTALVNEWAADRGRAALPYPLLALWLTLLGLLTVALLVVAIDDLRTVLRVRDDQPRPGRAVAGEVSATLVWTGLIGTVGTVVTLLELRYPTF